MAGLLDEWRVADIAFFDFSKSFDTVSQKILVEKLVKDELDEQTLRLVEN